MNWHPNLFSMYFCCYLIFNISIKMTKFVTFFGQFMFGEVWINLVLIHAVLCVHHLTFESSHNI